MAFVLRRQAARVICFDPHGRILLIRSIDPADRAKPAWWELPGGGIDPGETPEAACLRELREEVGVTVRGHGAVRVDPARRSSRSPAGTSTSTSTSTSPTPTATPSGPTHLEAFEALAFQGHRWWEVDELMAERRAHRAAAPHASSSRRRRRRWPATLPDPPVDITPLDVSPLSTKVGGRRR